MGGGLPHGAPREERPGPFPQLVDGDVSVRGETLPNPTKHHVPAAGMQDLTRSSGSVILRTMPDKTGFAIGRKVDKPFGEAVERVKAELQEEGFGVLSEIDVQATLRDKLGQELESYLILGACNPQLAHRGLEIEPDLGVLLPCNVVVRRDQGSTYVSAMEPISALELAANSGLEPIAREASKRIKRAIERV